MTVDVYGNKVWRNSSGKLHRIDGPAIEHSNGDKSYCIDGKYHRIDGPAIEYVNDFKMWWYMNGEYLGLNDSGFWAFWDRLTLEQKKDPVLLIYLPRTFKL
jgi:hypothetical protein